MGLFQTTRWSLVLRTRDGHARDALEELCRSYRSPVLAYIRRHSVRGAEAEDLTQAFFERLLSHRVYEQADPELGRFRAFLLTALRRFLINADIYNRAAKRGGESDPLPLTESIDVEDLSAESDRSPEAEFDRAFALTVLRRAVAQLESDAAAAGRAAHFAQLKPLLSEDRAKSYAEVAQQLGLSVNAVTVAVHRLRKRLRNLVRAELGDTVDSEQEADAEFVHLRLALGKAVNLD
jgi:RNA polymerase sigma-70 factor (ECF subfamily)